MITDLYKHLLERNLFLTGDIDQQLCVAITKEITRINISDLEAEKYITSIGGTYTPKPINLFIESYGGEVYPTLGLFDVIRSSKAPVHTIALGSAMSCGLILLVAGKERYCTEHSTILVHSIFSGSMGKIEDIAENMIENERTQKMLDDIVTSSTIINQDKLNSVRKKKQDWYLTAEEAIKYKVVNGIWK